MSRPKEIRQQRREGVQGIDLLIRQQAEARRVSVPSYKWNYYGRRIGNLDEKGAQIIFIKAGNDQLKVSFSGEELEDFPAQPRPETNAKVRRIVRWCGLPVAE